MEFEPPIVVHFGSRNTHAGFAGDWAPVCNFPSMVGRTKTTPLGVYAGEKANDRRGILNITYPIEKGIITNWENMEELLRYTWEELRIDTEERAFLLTELAFNPKANRLKTTEIMFEYFNALGLSLENQAPLSLYSTGRTSGILVDSGYEVTNIIPLYQGFALDYAATRLDIGGRHLSEYLEPIIQSKGLDYVPSSLVEEIKRKCEVASDFETETARFTPQVFNVSNYHCNMPDISLHDELIRCPEALFQPNLILGLSSKGIHEAVFETIMKCDPRIRGEISRSIVLSGGGTLFGNIGSRLKREIAQLTETSLRTPPHVTSDPNREYATWIGGSMKAALSMFADCMISKDEYDAYGPQIVQRKCPNSPEKKVEINLNI
jgi:actin, other eukaryote